MRADWGSYSCNILQDTVFFEPVYSGDGHVPEGIHFPDIMTIQESAPKVKV
jgi:hypothetical protein